MKILTGLTLLFAISALAVVGVVAMRMESLSNDVNVLSQDILHSQSSLTASVGVVETRLKFLQSAYAKANQKTHDELKGDINLVQDDTDLAILEVNQLRTRITTEEEATSTITSQLSTVSIRLGDQLGKINASTSKFSDYDIRFSDYDIRFSDYDISFNSIYRNVWPSVFCLQVTSMSGQMCHGTGWLAADGLIVTAQHVATTPGMTVKVYQTGYPPFTATVKQVDAHSDVALLEYDITPLSKVQLNPLAKPLMTKSGLQSEDSIGSSLMALGYSGQLNWIGDDDTVGPVAANAGVLSQLLTSDYYGAELVMDVPVDPGDSGGPVFNTNGFVVGVTKSVARGYLGTFYAASIEEVYEAFPQLK